MYGFDSRMLIYFPSPIHRIVSVRVWDVRGKEEFIDML